MTEERPPAGANKRPTLQMSLLYERLLFDQLGRPAFVSPYNEIQSTEPPPMNMLLLVSNQWTNGVGHHRESTSLFGPRGELIVETDEVDFFLRDVSHAHRVDRRIGVTLLDDGRYRIHVACDGAGAIDHYFRVRFRAGPPAAEPESRPPM